MDSIKNITEDTIVDGAKFVDIEDNAISKEVIPDGAKFVDIDDNAISKEVIPDGAKFVDIENVMTLENAIPDGAKFVDDIPQDIPGEYCAYCQYKIADSSVKFCPNCGNKRITYRLDNQNK